MALREPTVEGPLMSRARKVIATRAGAMVRKETEEKLLYFVPGSHGEIYEAHLEPVSHCTCLAFEYQSGDFATCKQRTSKSDTRRAAPRPAREYR